MSHSMVMSTAVDLLSTFHKTLINKAINTRHYPFKLSHMVTYVGNNSAYLSKWSKGVCE